jgi:hypothetical protein
MDNTNKMINFSLPDFYYGFNVYLRLFDFKKNYPYIFYDDVNIKNIYGSFPNMTWNGGGFEIGVMPTHNNVVSTVEAYQVMNVPIKLTLTNPLLEERDMYDRYCNYILRMCENDINEVAVTSDIMEEHIRKNYPKYKINKSIISTEYQPYFLEEKYESSVLAKRENKNFELLKSVPFEKRHKIQILCNDPCPFDCGRVYEHYRATAIYQLYEHDIKEVVTQCTEIPTIFRRNFADNEQNNININDIRELYLPLGYNYFKISGRGLSVLIVTNIIEFLIKPEYHKDINVYLMEVCK